MILRLWILVTMVTLTATFGVSEGLAQELVADDPALFATEMTLPSAASLNSVEKEGSERIYAVPGAETKWFGGKERRQELAHRFDLIHAHPDDPVRHIGWGQPLVGTSWRNRPFHADLFAGAILLNNLIPGEVEQAGAFFDGLRLGYDFDHYWGTEVRLGFAEGTVTYPADDSFSGKSQVVLLDYNVQFYPWGDATWRPYATFGLGAAVFQYDDVLGRTRDQTQISMPFGLGLKYFLHRRFSLRLELLDNIAIGGSDADSSHNLSITGGVEYRFGAQRPSYVW